ncbi:hypothetical protein [Neorhizobium sp. NCHU2750]|uniref:hypothetical protein n=1 Tax=Neorhizobium sp. NCHU2750 TaxID=1825976 RepID=UPI0013C4681A
MTRNDFSTIPHFLLQRAESEQASAGDAGRDEPDAAAPALPLSGLTTLDPAAIAQALTMTRTPPETPGEAGLAEGREVAFTPPSASVDPTPAIAAEPAVARSPGRIDLSAGASTGGYSLSDLNLFSALTGYRLDMQREIWRAVDIEGRRTPIADRLFTTLAEEAFRLADRQRRGGLSAYRHPASGRPPAGTSGNRTGPERHLTIDDLAMVLPSIRRAAATIGPRGVSAFERLEAITLRMKSEASDAMLAGVIAETAVAGPALSVQ